MFRSLRIPNSTGPPGLIQRKQEELQARTTRPAGWQRIRPFTGDGRRGGARLPQASSGGSPSERLHSKPGACRTAVPLPQAAGVRSGSGEDGQGKGEEAVAWGAEPGGSQHSGQIIDLARYRVWGFERDKTKLSAMFSPTSSSSTDNDAATSIRNEARTTTTNQNKGGTVLNVREVRGACTGGSPMPW